MSIVDRLKKDLHGAAEIAAWLGDGGRAVDKGIAQSRADTCLQCPIRSSEYRVEATVASAIRRVIALKNGMSLRVNGEKSLGFCSDCGCSLRLLVWEGQDRVSKALTDNERNRLPKHCWKLNQP